MPVLISASLPLGYHTILCSELLSKRQSVTVWGWLPLAHMASPVAGRCGPCAPPTRSAAAAQGIGLTAMRCRPRCVVGQAAAAAKRAAAAAAQAGSGQQQQPGHLNRRSTLLASLHASAAVLLADLPANAQQQVGPASVSGSLGSTPRASPQRGSAPALCCCAWADVASLAPSLSAGPRGADRGCRPAVRHHFGGAAARPSRGGGGGGGRQVGAGTVQEAPSAIQPDMPAHPQLHSIIRAGRGSPTPCDLRCTVPTCRYAERLLISQAVTVRAAPGEAVEVVWQTQVRR